MTENTHTRRPDIVLFVNGLPPAVIEPKNPTDENATIWSAHRQLRTYQVEIPSLFAFITALIVADGMETRIGDGMEGGHAFGRELKRRLKTCL